MKNVARGDDEIGSLFDASNLTSGVSVTREIDGPRVARSQMSKRGNVEAVGRFAAKTAIVHPIAATTADLVGAFYFSR